MGKIVEHADRLSLFNTPLHPYTWALLSAVPSVDASAGRNERVPLTGDPPNPINPPPGCRFASRCPFAEARCRTETPALRDRRRGTPRRLPSRRERLDATGFAAQDLSIQGEVP